MLNISKLKSDNNKFIKYNKENDYIHKKGNNNYYSPLNAEWSDNIYSFNKNDIKLLSIKHNLILKLIKSYFNMSILKLEKKIRKRKNKRPIWKILNSSKRFFISKPNLNHTTDQVTITIFVYNRQKNIIISKYNKLKTILVNLLFKNINKKNNFNNFFKQKFTILSSKLITISNTININKSIAIINMKKIPLLKKILRKLNKLMFLRKIYSLNDFKFKSLYILPLIKLLEKIYNKKVNINIINLKYYYLNSDILTQILAYKVNKRKDRGKAYKLLKSSIRKIKTPKVNVKTIVRKTNKITNNKKLKESLQYLPNNQLNNFSYKNCLINNKNYYNTFYKNLQSDILNSIKNKNINGIRLEIAGRITRRITAQRAGYKYGYIGTLKNLDSSYKGLSFPILKGNTKSNIQHTKLKSKTIIGSFGIKGWISSK